MFILLVLKETPMINFINKFINQITYIKNQPLSTTLLHASIITTFIVSINSTSTYLESNPYNSNIKGILALYVILWLLFVVYLFLIGRAYYLS